MSTSVASVVSHFPDAENGFTTTTAGSVSSGAATVTLNSVAGYTNGEPVVLVIDPTDASKKQTFTGIVDTSGVQITSVVWTAGTNQTHALGATVVDYATATHIAMMSKGIKVEHNQDGTHKAALITSRTEDTAPDVGADFLLAYDTSATALKKVKPSNLGLTSGWIAGQLPAVSSVTNNGNRSYDVTFASTVASYLTPGMRVRTSRTVAAPTYMGGAFNGTNHYFTKVTCTSTLSTVTDNFTIVATYQPTSYAAGQIGGRADAASNNAMSISMESDGRVSVSVFNGGVANYRQVSTYQSLPLNKKTKIAASWASGTVVIYFDGVSVPVATAITGGTAPTTAGTGGDFSIGRKGAYNANYANGYISGFGVFNAVLTAATIKSYDPQVLSGSETNCIGAWSLNNTAVNQQAAGTNDLTATNSVGYTSGIAPYATDATGTATGTYDYGIVTKVATTVATVQVPEGCTIPTSGGVSAVDLSAYKSPYGFPAQRGRWQTITLCKITESVATGVSGVMTASNFSITIPVGQFEVLKQGAVSQNNTVAGVAQYSTRLNGASSGAVPGLTTYQFWNPGSVTGHIATVGMNGQVSQSSAEVYTVQCAAYAGGGTTTVILRGDLADFQVIITPAHL